MDAQIQSVTREFPLPDPYPNPFVSFLQGAVNQWTRPYMQRQQDQEAYKKMLFSAFPNLAATKQVTPTTAGEPGIFANVPQGMPNWKFAPQQAQQDWSDLNAEALYKQRMGQLPPDPMDLIGKAQWNIMNSTDAKDYMRGTPDKQAQMLSQQAQAMIKAMKETQPAQTSQIESQSLRKQKAIKLLEGEGKEANDQNINWVLQNYDALKKTYGDKL